MNNKEISFIFVAIFTILGWNVFLIQRDNALYKSYYKQKAMENLKHPPSSEIGYSPKEKFCKSQVGWSPDCNIE
jgi:hypothetical protein